jgi:hypothetical protein
LFCLQNPAFDKAVRVGAAAHVRLLRQNTARQLRIRLSGNISTTGNGIVVKILHFTAGWWIRIQ